MKKITALFLLIIFSFNWFAYQFVIDYSQLKNNLDLEELFDRELYDESQLVEMKIAINLPYQTSRPAYERVDGEIELEGILYKYVKRKVSNDTLFLMCIPNTHKMTLETVKNDFFKRTIVPDKSTPSNNGDSGWSVLKQLQNITNESFLVFDIFSLPSDQDKNWFDGIAGSMPDILPVSVRQPPDC